MNYQYLGVDETKPGALFVRLVNPTESDKVAKELARLIRSYYSGWDLANIDLWRKLGWDVTRIGNPLQDFLQNYILLARQEKSYLSERSKQWWIDTMHARYNIPMDDLKDYIRAMLDMISAGTMPDTILKPYTYEPTELGEDFSKNVFPKLVLAAAVIGGVMVLSNTLIPQITSSVGAARARRKK